MIFLTVGTQEPFDRLVKAVDLWSTDRSCGDRVFAQITARGEYRPTSFEWVTTLDPAGYMQRCQEATLIVSHAGIGSIISALRLGKPIVIMPRRAHLGEQRNDHQWATAKRFGDRPGIYTALKEDDVMRILDRLIDGTGFETATELQARADHELINTIRSFIMDQSANVGSAQKSDETRQHGSG